ncbi:MAG: hypothetical protein ACI8WB_002795 [Phenylobacterium sp.]|jgi:hypothetical protein
MQYLKSYLQAINFNAKILFLIVPAIIGLVVMTLLQVSSHWTISQSDDEISDLTQLTIINSALVHEMQKERGATAAFLGSEGKLFADILRSQRQKTDAALSKQRSYVKQHLPDLDNQAVQVRLNSIAAELSKLASTRSQADSLSISMVAAIQYYTVVNAKVIGITALIGELALDGHVANQLVAYYNFLEAKERAGIERAVLSNAFANDNFAAEQFSRFLALVAEQDTYFSVFSRFAALPLQKSYKNALNHPSAKQVELKRTIATNQASAG